MKKDPTVRMHIASLNPAQLVGKKVAVIGGTGGIGRALAREFAAHGAAVTVVGQTFRDADVSNIEFIRADLSSMQEANRVATLLPAETLDLVIFTTGIFAAPKRQETVEGLERDMAVSYLSRQVILQAIAPRLGSQLPSGHMKPRVFIMGYPGTGQAGKLGDLNSERSYSAMAAHMNTVAGNEMLVLDSAQRYPNINTYGLNPGLIKTDIRSNFMGGNKFLFAVLEGLIGVFTPTADAYARRVVPLLVNTQLNGLTGVLFNSKGHAILPSDGLSTAHIRAFLTESRALIERAIDRQTA
jgi:NAD(P)-dependent dehydrogenase (short-subunit alcohol dehydrogenase family)